MTSHALELLAGSRWYMQQRAPGVRCVCAHQMAALFCVKWCHDRHLESVTSNRTHDSVNRCEFTWRTILPNFIPIWFETTKLRLFEDDRPHKNSMNKNNKTSSDMGSVPGPKTLWNLFRFSLTALLRNKRRTIRFNDHHFITFYDWKAIVGGIFANPAPYCIFCVTVCAYNPNGRSRWKGQCCLSCRFAATECLVNAGLQEMATGQSIHLR